MVIMETHLLLLFYTIKNSWNFTDFVIDEWSCLEKIKSEWKEKFWYLNETIVENTKVKFVKWKKILKQTESEVLKLESEM
jgi:hypothetical protein